MDFDSSEPGCIRGPWDPMAGIAIFEEWFPDYRVSRVLRPYFFGLTLVGSSACVVGFACVGSIAVQLRLHGQLRIDHPS